jgi:hypothetical protein
VGSHRLKLQRAFEHLQALQAAVHLWAETEPCIVSHECDVQTRTHTLVQRTVSQPTDPIFAWLIGDVVHNMRQGLDHLAYQLAIRVCGTEPPKNAATSMWPIRPLAKLSGAIPNDIGPKNKMPTGMYAAIERFQTDAGSDGALLGVLHALDNWDKHRFPPLVAGLAEAIDLQGLRASGGVIIPGVLAAVQVSGVGRIRLGAYDDGKLIPQAGSEANVNVRRIRLGAYDDSQLIVQAGSEMNVNVRPTASIAFAKTYDIAPGELVLPLLEAISDTIVDRVFPTMEKFL